MEKTTLKRSFSFNGLKLPEPDEQMSVEEVKSFYANQYPELTTAAISGPEIVGNSIQYTFSRAIGTKG
jgi:PRTRC genetic system protein C